MTSLMTVKYKAMKELLNNNFFYGFTVKRTKRVLLYNFRRYLPSKGKFKALSVKVMAKTKYVISVRIGEDILINLEDVTERIKAKC